jgi:hypothetical protein
MRVGVIMAQASEQAIERAVAKYHEAQKVKFETQLKTLIRKHSEAGALAIPDEDVDGVPSDYGCLENQDMVGILENAAKRMTECALDYLYTHEPLPKKRKATKSAAAAK